LARIFVVDDSPDVRLALATLKADTLTSPIPVIMVTAKCQPEDMAMVRSIGTVEYITKPKADGGVKLRGDWAIAADHEHKSPQFIT